MNFKDWFVMNIQVKLAIISIIIVIPLSIFVLYATDSSKEFTSNDDSNLKVISSFYPLYEFSKIVGQEKIDATLLVPVGVEPHDWEPTIKDVQEMQNADLIIINGIGFESWVDNLQDAGYSGDIIDTSNGIQVKPGDPHIWLNPVYAKSQVQNIANAFSNSDPANKQYYQSNAASYIKELESLDSTIRKELSGCNSDFIAFHDAFSYFAEEYELNQHTIISSTNSHGEVTAKTLESVIITAQKLNIKIIFAEETANTKTSQVIADEIGGIVLVLSPLETASEETYISKMTQNLENLKQSLC